MNLSPSTLTNRPVAPVGGGASRSVGRRLLNGTVTGVKLADRSIAFRTTNGLERLVVATNAHLLRAGQIVKLQDIRVGERGSVIVRRRADGAQEVFAFRLAPQPLDPGSGKRIGPPTPKSNLPTE